MESLDAGYSLLCHAGSLHVSMGKRGRVDGEEFFFLFCFQVDEKILPNRFWEKHGTLE